MSHRASNSLVPFRLTLCAALVGAMGVSSHAQQHVAASRFNQEFLGIGGDELHADLSLFAFGNWVMPGKYMVDVELNQRGVGKTEIVFASRAGAAEAVPCLQRRMLDEWGVNVSVFPALANVADDACVDLAATIPESTFSYDGGKQRLSISIPQAAMKRSARGWVDPAKWNRGITAGMLNYQLNAGHSSGNRYTSGGDTLRRDSLFGGVQGGFNYGDWRLRHFSTYNRGLDGQGRWQNVNTHLKRDLSSINAQLTIGDGNTPGNYFDSVPFRGVQIGSDEAMLPDSQQGYAPTIRGLARTNARVTVRQNGYVIYSTFVAPGAFVIDDLYPSSSSGDLEVTIEEADGRQTRYIQAFSAVPTMLREGTWRYSGAVGRYRNPSVGGYMVDGRFSLVQPLFAQATLARGLGNEVSLYGGVVAANMYSSLLAGVGKNLHDFGAVSADLSAARTIDRRPFADDKTYDGQSLRFLYAKAFLASGTNFRVAGYRYSTSGYRTFQEAVQVQNMASSDLAQTRRNELRFELSQQIGGLGSLYASARQQSYWGTTAKDRLVQMGYSGSYRQFGFNVFYNYSTNPISAPKRQVMFTVNIPLGDMRASAQYSLTRDEAGRIGQQATVSGATFDDRRLTYSVTAIGREGKGEGSVAADYLSPIGHWSASRSQGGRYGQSTLGVAGGVLFHDSGVTLSQTLGETVALVRVPGARDVGFENQVGLATDGAGNAVIPSVSPYRLNRVAVRTRDLGDTVEVKNAAMDVVPTRGAVVQADFETSVGYRLLMTLTNGQGRFLPLGSKVENEAGQEVGIVGPDGQAFVTGAADAGRLNVRWGRDPRQQCVVSYHLPDEKSPPPIRELNVRCEAPAPASVPAPASARPGEAPSKEHP